MLPTLKLQFYKKQKQKETLDIKSSVQCSVFRFFSLSSTFCLNSIIPNITPRGLFLVVVVVGGGGGVLIYGRNFPLQKFVRPGAYTRWGLLSEFYGIVKSRQCMESIKFLLSFFSFLLNNQPI